MNLPRLLLITDRRCMQPAFDAALEAALQGGAKLIQLREKDLSVREVLRLAQTAQNLCAQYNARLLINDRADIAALIHADGVHLPENSLPPQRARSMFSHRVLCGVSVHSVETAQRATSAGADYLIYGPVFSTLTHPRQTPAGLHKLQEVCRATPLPVLAVGGITPATARSCMEVGAHGIAVIRAVWEQPDVTQSARVLCAEVSA